MKRTNVITWVDVRVLTKFATQLLVSMADYAQRGFDQKNTLAGDQNVFVELITMRNKIDELLERHKKANEVRD